MLDGTNTLEIIKISDLFAGISESEFKSMARCMNFRIKDYKKDEYILMSGKSIQSFGLVLAGEVSIEHIDILGENNLINISKPGQLFAESYALAPENPLMVNVRANEKSQVLLMDTYNFLRNCAKNCSFHKKLIANLMVLLANKNRTLSEKIFHSTPKKMRDKILSYFSFEIDRQGSKDIHIPLNRQQLADYLGVDRSALSYELSLMKKEGLIDYKKNHFIIH